MYTHRILYSLVHTNSNESGFRRIFVFGTRFQYLLLIVTLARSQVKSKSYNDDAHLHPITNVCTQYQLRTTHGLCDTAWTNVFPLTAHPDTMGVG